MKYNLTKTLFTLCFFAFILLMCQSCNKSYEREDSLVRYTKEKNYKFDNQQDYYLLVLRDIRLSCSATKYGYNKELAISYAIDKIKNKPIYILLDNQRLYIKLLSSYAPFKNLHFTLENPEVMDQYGFYFAPYLFRIKNNKIKEWSNISKYAKTPDQ